MAKITILHLAFTYKVYSGCTKTISRSRDGRNIKDRQKSRDSKCRDLGRNLEILSRDRSGNLETIGCCRFVVPCGVLLVNVTKFEVNVRPIGNRYESQVVSYPFAILHFHNSIPSLVRTNCTLICWPLAQLWRSIPRTSHRVAGWFASMFWPTISNHIMWPSHTTKQAEQGKEIWCPNSRRTEKTLFAKISNNSRRRDKNISAIWSLTKHSCFWNTKHKWGSIPNQVWIRVNAQRETPQINIGRGHK